MDTYAALYLRSSKDRHDVSIDAQRTELQQLAQARGLTIRAEFVDAVESGKDEDRPGFQALIAAVRNHRRGWSTVLALDTSRIARRRQIAIMFEEIECRKHGVRVIYKSLPDADPITEMLLKSILQAMDEWHSLTSKRKGLAGMRENVRQGWRAGGKAPMGYRLVHRETGAVRDGQPVLKSVLEPDSHTAEQVGRYLRDRAMGIARKRAKVAAKLSHVLDSTLVGVEWNALTYAGHTVWNVNGEREGGRYVGGTKRRPRSEWVIQRDTHSPLITDAEAELILGRLERAAKARQAGVKRERDRVSAAMLSGLLFAPDGTKWWSESDRYRYKAGGVQRSVARETLESLVLEQIFADLSRPEFAEALVNGARKALAGTRDRSEIRKLQRQALELERQMAKLMDLVVEVADRRPILRRIEALELERQGLVAKAEQLQLEADLALPAEAITLPMVQRLLATLAEEAKENAHSGLRASLSNLIERVELDPKTLSATLSYRIAAPVSGARLASPRGFEPRSPP
ncbi:MAG: resolvase [Silanimonas sp.]|nr:MAG: resolvase [Silanimonas sp.]